SGQPVSAGGVGGVEDGADGLGSIHGQHVLLDGDRKRAHRGSPPRRDVHGVMVMTGPPALVRAWTGTGKRAAAGSRRDGGGSVVTRRGWDRAATPQGLVSPVRVRPVHRRLPRGGLLHLIRPRPHGGMCGRQRSMGEDLVSDPLCLSVTPTRARSLPDSPFGWGVAS